MPSKDSSKVPDGLRLVDSHESTRAGRNDISDGVSPAPREAISPKRQKISDLWTILCAGCALISDGYANSLMTLVNVVLKAEYPRIYTSSISTRISNALLIGEILGQIIVG